MALAATGLLLDELQCYKEYTSHNGARTYNPDLNPGVPDVSSNALHGLRKLDCVTVWFLG